MIFKGLLLGCLLLAFLLSLQTTIVGEYFTNTSVDTSSSAFVDISTNITTSAATFQTTLNQTQVSSSSQSGFDAGALWSAMGTIWKLPDLINVLLMDSIGKLGGGEWGSFAGYIFGSLIILLIAGVSYFIRGGDYF